jgi:uncharacterized protein (TIGR04222 family)
MSLNPFHLGGPAFLAFYVALMVVTVIALRASMRARELADAPPAPKFEDPYLIAWLRGGDVEAARVATVALVDRGLLTAQGSTLALRDPQAVEIARRDIERALLRLYRNPGSAQNAHKDAAVRRACERYRQTLAQHGLVAGGTVFARRLAPIAIAAAVLLGVSGARIAQALAAGRHNLAFLTILTVVAAVILVAHWGRRRTFAGDAALADLKALFSRLKGRAATLRAGGGAEVAMLAAVFGLAALPGAAFPFVEKLYPAPANSSDGGGSSCGSSCSSSCGGGCGGGCGGD